MAQPRRSPSFSDYRTVGEAAAFLGVSPATLRNWDRSGKLKPRRHPNNGYRIYRHEDLVAVLRSADHSRPAQNSSAPVVDWSEIAEDEHFVQFYESDEYLVTSVVAYLRAALGAGQMSIVVPTTTHRASIQSGLAAAGIDVDEALTSGRFIVLDAAETLSKLLVDGLPDSRRFHELMGGVMTRLGRGNRRIHAFGEMVALLWAAGNRHAAIHLEALWNELRRSHQFALFCAYPLRGFGEGSDAAEFEGVCACHTRVIPAESYSGIASHKDRLRAITSLQQKAQSLESEIAHRHQVEKELSERQQEAERRKDEFLATLAHELRNPLAPIRNAVELMRLDELRGDGSDETLQVVDRQTRHLTRLVDDLLDVSRITRDKLRLRKERVDLSPIIASAVETSRPLLEAAGHTLTVSLPSVPVLLEADPARLSQLFANLLNNSAKFTSPGGRIAIDVETDEHEVAVTVRDNGIGIAHESLACLFDMFWQASRTLNRAPGGLGIGLTLVRRLVELHGGTVQAQSEGLAKGSQFVVRLPLASTMTVAAVSEPSDPRTLASRRILVVDDNPDSATTLSSLLEHKGNDVRVAQDGVEAVSLAEEFRPDIIVMDMGMPKMDGYEATRQIRQKPWGKEIFIVALSGWGQVGDVRQSVEAGCSAHMVKPAEFTALEQLLASRQPSKS